ncbi:MAG: type IX secretion system sortase PorU [Flavobacteriia bacterium]|nr:type IX secretion system sortase PorU [Flavobacteriia bacterium]
MFPIKNHLFLILFSLFFSFTFSQNENYNLGLKWKNHKSTSYEGQTIFLPEIENQEYNGSQITYSWRKEIGKNHNFKIEIKNIEKVIADKKDIQYIQFFHLLEKNGLQFSFSCQNSRNERFASLSFFPYIKEGNQYYKIVSLSFDLIKIQNVSNKSHSFADNSVLGDANSSWYKVSVSSDGIVKIDKSWLESNGIIQNNFNPNHFHVFGNGAGKLSEKNSDPKLDDLKENAILFVGDSDQSLEDGEFFLLYAWGPHKWNSNNGTFSRDINIYEDLSYYFIRISSAETPLRIQSSPTPTFTTVTDVNSFNHYDIIENENYNLVGGGQRWYGELLDVELSQTYTFSTPNLISSNEHPVQIKSFVASIYGENASTLNYSINGQNVKTQTLNSGSSDYYRQEISFSHVSGSSSLPITVSLSKHKSSVQSYIDKIEINARRNLVFSGTQFRFRDFNSVQMNNKARFTVQGVESNYFVWDITDRQIPKVIETNFNSGQIDFVVAVDSLREFVCSNNRDFSSFTFVKTVGNQNLHALAPKKLLIVTHPDFLSEAQRLAGVHEADGTSSLVVTTEQVYNEFSGGGMDPTAIKWFAKMFYQRAGGDINLMPENLLLFGDGTYDPKNRVENNNNFIPTYQTQNTSTEDHLNNLVSDDYFGLLDDSESFSQLDLMDIGVGRMIVSDATQAKEMVDKVIQYLKTGINQTEVNVTCNPINSSCSSYGDWRTKYVQIADDEAYFIESDTEPQYYLVKNEHPEMNSEKLYLDAFSQIASAGGDRYPEVFNAITRHFTNGALVINYVGHGGEVGAADERIITIPQIQSWTNWCNMPLFVSATCEFTKFDDPKRVSAGEHMYLNPNGGAIALTTTTRTVFYGVNTNIGKSFYQNVFDKDLNGKGLSFGEIMRRTKNGVSDSNNKRSFNLIGDPAIRIALPQMKVVTDSINGYHASVYVDTLKALSKVVIKGHVENLSGQKISNFNGILNPTIFDKSKKYRTLGQDAKAAEIEFEMQKNALFKGKVSVKDGDFTFTFIVPKDIDYKFGLGKISYYSNSEILDAGGIDTMLYIGGISAEGLNDIIGPEIDMYFNNNKFIDGGLINDSPVLIANIEDESGINMVGNGIGHDITAVLDDNTAEPIILNEYFTNDLDSYQKGKVNFKLTDLEKGKHSLTLKVWDVNNNSSEKKINFEVRESELFGIRHVLNYPNPFTTNTNFYFEHNQLCSTLDVMIQIMTISGKLVKTIRQEVYNDCFRSDGINWDGNDDYGDQLAKGVYIYRLRVKNQEGFIAEKLEKLVILK